MSDISTFFKDDNFSVGVGIEILEVSPGYARLSMPVDDRHVNADGFCHGGAIFTLADQAFAVAVNSRLQHTVSISAQIAFLRPGRRGILYATAQELFNHPRLPYARVEITDEQGELVAVFTASGYRRTVRKTSRHKSGPVAGE